MTDIHAVNNMGGANVSCPATLRCGPGHQSQVQCERRDEHHEHLALGRVWCGDGASSTDFFDKEKFCTH